MRSHWSLELPKGPPIVTGKHPGIQGRELMTSYLLDDEVVDAMLPGKASKLRERTGISP